MEIFIFLIFVGVIIAIAVSKHSKALNENWQQAARRLDLQYTAGSARSMRGTRPTMHLLIAAKSAGKTQWTEYSATFKKALPVTLKLHPQGFFSDVANSIFNRVDIEIGDPLFDSGVIVEGSPPEDVRAFLDQEVVAGIKRLIAQFDSFEVTHRGITTKRSRIVKNVDLLVRDVEVIDKVARLLVAKGEGEEEKPFKTPPPIPKKEDKEARVPPPLPAREEVEEIEEAEVVAEIVSEVVPHVIVEVEEEEPPIPVPEPMTLMDLEIEEEPSPAEKTSSCLVVESWLDDFSEGASHYEFVRIFEERWKDIEVSGEATLRSVESYSMDRIFGRGPGIRLFFELGDLKSGDSLILITNSKAGESISKLRSQVGETLSFEGTLIRCDAFEHTLFLQVPPGEKSLATGYATTGYSTTSYSTTSYASTYSPASTVLSETVSSDPSK